jgi:hypothetical protein
MPQIFQTGPLPNDKVFRVYLRSDRSQLRILPGVPFHREQGTGYREQVIVNGCSAGPCVQEWRCLAGGSTPGTRLADRRSNHARAES